MTDKNTPLRELVDRSGYAFNMAVAEIISSSHARHHQQWRVEATEIPWSRSKDSGFIDVAITRDKAIGIIECKKVNNEDPLVFLTRHDQSRVEIRCRLEVYLREHPDHPGASATERAIREMHEPRYVVGECTMPTGSPESGNCVAPKGGKSAGLNLDDIASHLLESCEGLLGDWSLKLSAKVTGCVPIIVTNAMLYTCAFDPATMDLGSGDVPSSATFQSQPFVRFRKAFRHSPGLGVPSERRLTQVVEQGARTVFVVDARQLVPFLGGLRDIRFPLSDDDHAQLVDG